MIIPATITNHEQLPSDGFKFHRNIIGTPIFHQEDIRQHKVKKFVISKFNLTSFYFKDFLYQLYIYIINICYYLVKPLNSY
jgi:hypothetical protein